ncbi:hypothetical protein BpHYR1_013988 [Brachionus plicatilis]|uniref:Uncharacterized protein n=1 Tax=Brachionus plicatilis TaxID=10195 RepID=A0A3M7SSG8_BRAPC|nr:hypothetical protein BpHYR1_013988 [Brachionus plicatilis]
MFQINKTLKILLEKSVKKLLVKIRSSKFLAFLENTYIILSFSEDNSFPDVTIKYLKISTLECIRTFVGQIGFIISLLLFKTRNEEIVSFRYVWYVKILEY